MGIVAGERVFKVIDTESFIRKEGSIDASNIQGNIEFNQVRFSYIKNEEVLKGISFQVQKGRRSQLSVPQEQVSLQSLI